MNRISLYSIALIVLLMLNITGCSSKDSERDNADGHSHEEGHKHAEGEEKNEDGHEHSQDDGHSDHTKDNAK
jgi:ABC-type nickel/cobalt efflux system permease component RcnA